MANHFESLNCVVPVIRGACRKASRRLGCLLPTMNECVTLFGVADIHRMVEMQQSKLPSELGNAEVTARGRRNYLRFIRKGNDGGNNSRAKKIKEAQRHPVKGSVYAVWKSPSFRIGSVVDISRGGVAFHYVSVSDHDRALPEGSVRLDDSRIGH